MGALRLFLAFVVLASHARVSVLPTLGLDMPAVVTLWLNGSYAVFAFYVISGFLISTALAEKYPPGAAGLRAFYAGRVTRLFSLYWPMALLTLVAVPMARYAFTEAIPAQKFSQIFLLGLDWNVAIAGDGTRSWAAVISGLEQSWSLGTELAFYLLAPALLRSFKLATFALVASVLLRYGIANALGAAGVLWNYCVMPATLCFFLLGHFARLAAAKWPWLRRPQALAMLVVCCAFAEPEAPWDGLRFWLIFFSFAAALPALFALTKDSRLLNYLGDLSYPLYLTHVLLVRLITDHGLWSLLAPHLPKGQHGGIALMVLLTAAALAVSAFVHALIERPCGRILRALLRGGVRTERRGSIAPAGT